MATAAQTGPFGFDPARSDALSELLAQHWWAVGLRGILAIIFGLICLLTPGIAVGAFVIVFAAYMFVDGAFAIISGIRAARSGEQWGLLILEGIVDLAAGILAVVWPAITLVALVWIVAIWRHSFAHLRHPADHRAFCRRSGPDIVDRCLRSDFWDLLACAGFPAQLETRSATSQDLCNHVERQRLLGYEPSGCMSRLPPKLHRI